MAKKSAQPGRRFAFLTAAGAVALFLALALQQRIMEETVRRRVLVDEGAGAAPRPMADVSRAIRAMKLVTVEIETTVTTTVQDESWRGDITARVSAPAKLSYGTDLSTMEVRSLGFSPVTKSYVVRIPRPTRIATEVWAEMERAEVTTGWLRLRSRAGEYYLGLARKALTERARQMRLSEADAEKVSATTKKQVGNLVKGIVGNGARVEVVFSTPPGAGEASAVGVGNAGIGKVEP